MAARKRKTPDQPPPRTLDLAEIDAVVTVQFLAGGEIMNGTLDIRFNPDGPYVGREVEVGQALKAPMQVLYEAVGTALGCKATLLGTVESYDAATTSPPDRTGPPPTVSAARPGSG